MKQPSGSAGDSDRKARLRSVVEECLGRLNAGETLNASEVVAANPDLMPELGDALDKLLAIKAARDKANDISSIPTTAADEMLRKVASETESEIGPAPEMTGSVGSSADGPRRRFHRGQGKGKGKRVRIEPRLFGFGDGRCGVLGVSIAGGKVCGPTGEP